MKTFAQLNFPGRLIAVEGLDGSGKSTQIYLLKRWLEAEGIKVYFSEWNSSELVKSATSKGKKRELLTPTTFSLIHATDFADRYERHLVPLLRAGYIVLCDRYVFTAFARDVLSVADNLDRALAAIPADLRADEKMKGLVVGLEATGRELHSVFGRHGLSRIEAMGQPLDPNRHQAMMEVASDAEPGTIVQEMQTGWMIKDRLLRPALVAVAKKPD